MTLKTLVFLFIFGLGFILGKLCSTEQIDRMDDSNQVAYAYDTEQKVEDFYKMFEIQFSEKTGLPPESPEVKEYMAMVRREQGRPLDAVGPFAFFVDNDGGKFSVREIQSVKQEANLLLPLVELEISEQSKRLRLYSSQEKGFGLPRFSAQFTYSEDGIYERGHFAVHRKDGALERMYFDSKGSGAFDVMNVFEHEAGVRFIYSLNDLTWELVGKQWYSEKEKIRVDDLLKDYRRVFGGSEQVDHNTSNDNQDVDVEQIDINRAN
jgi:hypothetical protein